MLKNFCVWKVLAMPGIKALVHTLHAIHLWIFLWLATGAGIAKIFRFSVLNAWS
jgi:hypothetical protein